MSKDGQDTTPPIPSSSEVSLGVRIDKICGEFEEQLKAGKAPKIETYLAQVPNGHAGQLLEELLGLELDYRAKAGDSFTSEEYTLRFPEHASSVAELVVNVRRNEPVPTETSTQRRPGRTPPTHRHSDSSASTERSGGDPIRIGPYEIIGPCGRGGMGVVYKAWHEFFKQYRAIKVLPSDFDDDDISRFSMEIELAGRLNHPNIVRAHEAAREQGVLYLVMEYVDGINLDHLVKHHKQIPLGLACEMIRQAAEGLQHAHEHFLVHRDIKPSNLMISKGGQVKILDFGLARLHAEQHASRLTKHGSVMGTLDFMAPEQWEDPMGATIQADIYSLGCTLYYLVTGTPPYGGEDYSHWLKKQEAHRKQPVPKIEHENGEALQPIINRMMAKSKSERFLSPAEVVEALAPLSDETELTKYAETPQPALSTSGISRTPIPTVNVSTSELAERPFEQFPGDSEPNSGAKTIRPNQMRTDIDSDVEQMLDARPPRTPWHRSAIARISLAVLAVVLLAAAWFSFRPAQNVELAEQMGALPGLNGGLNGDWWFAEMPWYTPGVRKAFMEALRNGETQIGDVSLENWEEKLASTDTQSLQRELTQIAKELKRRIPEPEQSWTGQILVASAHSAASIETEQSEIEKSLLNIIEKSLPNADPDRDSLSSKRSPTELHFLANILHQASTTESLYAAQAERFYRTAIEAYDVDDPVEAVLHALVRSDYSRFLADRREYSASIDWAERAAEAVPNAALFQISLHCGLADQFRKFGGDSKNALEQIAIADSWAEKMNLADKHPLRAEILERRAWVNVDAWHMQKAFENFSTATTIRQANQQQGNKFAWRSILVNQQGQAMALHFLGRDGISEAASGESKEGTALWIYEQLKSTISDPPKGLPFGTLKERQSRLPNLRERWGDVYLFGRNTSYSDAETKYREAASSADMQGFGDSATLWFHLTRLYYKQALAHTLKLDAGESDGESAGSDAFESAKKLEGDFRDDAAFAKQEGAFKLERDVAIAFQTLYEEERLGENRARDGGGVAQLLSVIQETNESQVNRGNIEVLLLVFEALFQRSDDLEARQVNRLVADLLDFTTAMRESDDNAIFEYHLRPVFERADSALKKLPPRDQYPEVKSRLKIVIP